MSFLLDLIPSLAGITTYISFVLGIMEIIGMWFLFEKADEPGWKALIPLYNMYILYNICWEAKFYFAINLPCTVVYSFLKTFASNNPFLSDGISMLLNALAILLLLATVAIQFFLCRKLTSAFYKSDLFTVGLFFLYPVFILILGLGNSSYYGNRRGRY